MAPARFDGLVVADAVVDATRAPHRGTFCINAGSEANMGILRGYLVDVGPDGVERTLRVEG